MSEDEVAIAGLRILILEDEALLSLLLEETLKDLGCIIAGNVLTLDAARAFLDGEPGPLDVAILDVNIGEGRSYSIAEDLAARGIPCLFVTGHDEGEIDENWRDHPRLSKPFNVPDLGAAIARTVGRGSTQAW